MFGKNKILKAESHDGLNLDIQEIFPTFQGEGPYVGHPALFIRLGGCNLTCNFCDTEFESYKNLPLKKIIEKVLKLSKNENGKTTRQLVVITGGEPLRQPIEKLCEELVKLDYLVQVETNGTLFRDIPKEVKIICSPKVTNGKYYKIRQDLLSRIDAFKFILSSTNKDYINISEVGQSEFNIPVYLQPMDEYNEDKNKDNIKHTLNLCEKLGYRISLQTHKILEIQ